MIDPRDLTPDFGIPTLPSNAPFPTAPQPTSQPDFGAAGEYPIVPASGGTILLPGGQRVVIPALPQPPQQFAPAQSDPDLLRKQQFQREVEAQRANIEREIQRLNAEQALRLQTQREGSAAAEAEKQRAAEAERLRQQQQFQTGLQQQQQQFTGGQNEAQRALEAERNRIAALEQQSQAANQNALRALEQGKLEESKRQFDLSQSLAQQRFQLEQQRAREDYEAQQQEMAFGALKFLTDLSRNPRTALASFFLNRGLQPPDAAGQTSPIPAGLNVTNIAETLPKFLQGILGAARAGASPSSTPAATATTGSAGFTPAIGSNLVQSLTQAGVVPPFLQRVLAQQQGIPEQGTNAPQTGAPPEGVPLVSSLALLQMSPSEREGLRGVVEASGMAWEDYLDLIQKGSPAGGVTPAQTPEFAFVRQ